MLERKYPQDPIEFKSKHTLKLSQEDLSILLKYLKFKSTLLGAEWTIDSEYYLYAYYFGDKEDLYALDCSIHEFYSDIMEPNKIQESSYEIKKENIKPKPIQNESKELRYFFLDNKKLHLRPDMVEEILFIAKKYEDLKKPIINSVLNFLNALIPSTIDARWVRDELYGIFCETDKINLSFIMNPLLKTLRALFFEQKRNDDHESIYRIIVTFYQGLTEDKNSAKSKVCFSA